MEEMKIVLLVVLDAAIRAGDGLCRGAAVNCDSSARSGCGQARGCPSEDSLHGHAKRIVNDQE